MGPECRRSVRSRFVVVAGDLKRAPARTAASGKVDGHRFARGAMMEHFSGARSVSAPQTGMPFGGIETHWRRGAASVPTNDVLVLSGFWPTQSNPISGIFVSQQIAALCRAGCRVTVLIGEAIGKKRDRHLGLDELGLPPGRVTLTTVPLLRAPEALSANRTLFAFNVRSIGLSVSAKMAAIAPANGVLQACLVHGLRYYTVSAPFWAASLSAPKIAFLHGVDPFVTRPSVASFVGPYVTQAQDHINTVVLVGTSLRRHAAELGFDTGKTVVIPNGTEIPPLSECLPDVGAGDGILRIASVSNLIALKGIDDNIRALSLLKERHGIDRWRYSIVGEGPERTRLEALAASLGLQDRIRFLGRLPYRETMQQIARADVFSLPSWGEAFGIVYLEAMARMRPTIGCLENGAADIITDGVDGMLVPPRDFEALALAFQRLATQPGLRRELGRNARRTAEGYSWDIHVARLLDVINAPRRHS